MGYLRRKANVLRCLIASETVLRCNGFAPEADAAAACDGCEQAEI
jgi:hypothetical protein